MKDISDIKEGFALKPQCENAPARGNKGKKVRGQAYNSSATRKTPPQQLHHGQSHKQAGCLRLRPNPNSRKVCRSRNSPKPRIGVKLVFFFKLTLNRRDANRFRNKRRMS